MFLYQVVNRINGKKYYGISLSPKRRWYSHKHAIKKGVKTKFYDAVRKYGESNFILETLEEGTEEYICAREIYLIANDATCYNLHQGGHVGFDVSTKDAQSVAEWKAKLREKRKGRTPAKGMRHSEETKKLCGDYSKLRWDIHGRYPADVTDIPFIKASEKYGISKTHYYRLKRLSANDAA